MGQLQVITHESRHSESMQSFGKSKQKLFKEMSYKETS